MGVNGDSAIERTRRWVSRVAIAATLGLLTAGLVLFETGSTGLSMSLFRGAFFVLVAMPIAAVSRCSSRRSTRDLTFVAAALGVLGLIAYSIFR